MIQNLIREYNIPVVEQHGSIEDPKAFIEYVYGLKNVEGFVVCFTNGYRVKIKTHEYIQIHKAKEAILQERHIVRLIIDENLDDIKAHLPVEDRNRLTQFESDFNTAVGAVVVKIAEILNNVIGNMDRKTFALEVAPNLDTYSRLIVFKNFEGYSLENLFNEVRSTIRNNLGSTAKYEAIRNAWFPGVARQ